MPEDHQKYLEWNSDRFRKWAEQIGINTYTVVNAISTSKSVEQQTYRSCMGPRKLPKESAIVKYMEWKAYRKTVPITKDNETMREIIYK